MDKRKNIFLRPPPNNAKQNVSDDSSTEPLTKPPPGLRGIALDIMPTPLGDVNRTDYGTVTGAVGGSESLQNDAGLDEDATAIVEWDGSSLLEEHKPQINSSFSSDFLHDINNDISLDEFPPLGLTCSGNSKNKLPMSHVVRKQPKPKFDKKLNDSPNILNTTNSTQWPPKTFFGEYLSLDLHPENTATEMFSDLEIISGTVVNMGYHKCILRSLQSDARSVSVLKSTISSGGIPVQRGDTIETQVIGDKALSAKVIEFKDRDHAFWEKYLQNTKHKVLDESNVRSSTVDFVELIKCPGVWKSLIKIQDMSTDYVKDIITVFLALNNNSSWKNVKYMENVSTILANDKFLKYNLSFQEYLLWDTNNGDANCNTLVFLLLIVQYCPTKSSLIVDCINKARKNSQDPNFWYNFMVKVIDVISQCHGPKDISEMLWNELPILPHTSELEHGYVKGLKRVQQKKPYRAASEYIDIYFRLQRAETFGSFQSCIVAYKSGNTNNAEYYNNIKFMFNCYVYGFYFDKNRCNVSVALKLAPHPVIQDWKNHSSLMFGNLVALSPSLDFKKTLWATVSHRSLKLLQKYNIILVEMFSGNNNYQLEFESIMEMVNCKNPIAMIESPAFFLACEPILETLRTYGLQCIPFNEEFIHCKSSNTISLDYIKSNEYSTFESQSNVLELADPAEELPDNYTCEFLNRDVTNITDNIYKVEETKLSEILYRNEECKAIYEGLDDSQKEAIRHCFSNRVSIIQGPPGTGKSFVGVAIIQLLYHSDILMNNKILLLSYKNRVLDDFLQDIIENVTDSVSRIGGGFLDTFPVEHLLFEQMKGKHNNINTKEIIEEIEIAFVELERAKVLTCNDMWQELTTDQKLSLRVKPKLVDPTINDLMNWCPSKELILLFVKQLTYFDMRSTGKFQVADFIEEDEGDIHQMEKDRSQYLGKKKDNLSLKRILKIENTDDILRMDDVAMVYIQECGNRLKTCPENMWTAVQDLNELSQVERIWFLQFLIWKRINSIKAKCLNLFKLMKEIKCLKNESTVANQVAVLKNTMVIGMTVTGSSIYSEVLRRIKPEVVVVEEAAEVTEPQLLAALGPWVKHLILIGDHKQLKPTPKYKDLLSYGLDCSMMERLINNKMPHVVLKYQNRMLPQFAELLKDIYPELQSNLDRVSQIEPPTIIKKPMYFWTHNEIEQQLPNMSYNNLHEAQRVVALVLFFIYNGYSPQSVTVLAAYKGQTVLIRKLIKKEHKLYPHLKLVSKIVIYEDQYDSDSESEDDSSTTEPQRKVFRTYDKVEVNISTIDGYQGDENDVVIVSLVRSNENNQIGFLQQLNRRCVAQSRARCGLYFIGNVNTFMSNENWETLISKMRAEDCVSQTITLCCPVHNVVVKAKSAKEVPSPSSVYCSSVCGKMLDCEHKTCTKTCKPYHLHINNRCETEVRFNFADCDHSTLKPCYKGDGKLECELPCEKLLDGCNEHKCPYKCGEVHYHFYCEHDVEILLKCGHKVTKLCYESEIDIKCYKEVNITLANCKHSVVKECWQDEHIILCQSPCERESLLCGHQCGLQCGQSCGRKCSNCLKEDERDILDDKQELFSKIKYQIKEIKKGKLSRSPLSKDDKEYKLVEQLFCNFMKPAGIQRPNVSKIEVIVNPGLMKKWLELRMELVDPYTEPQHMFSGLAAEDINRIASGGFKSRSNNKSYSDDKRMNTGLNFFRVYTTGIGGVQLTTEGGHQILLSKVLLGAQQVQNHDNEGEFDSVFSGEIVETFDEVEFYEQHTVRRWQQALPAFVIHYKVNL